jgi:hypothetical protein
LGDGYLIDEENIIVTSEIGFSASFFLVVVNIPNEVQSKKY